jgi:Ion transport protein
VKAKQWQASAAFQHACTAVRLTDVAALISQYDSMSPRHQNILSALHTVTGILYLIEFLVNVLANGTSIYVDSGEQFNLCMVMITTADLFISLQALASGSHNLEEMRSMRVLRALRVLHIQKVFRCGILLIIWASLTAFTSNVHPWIPASDDAAAGSCSP